MTKEETTGVVKVIARMDTSEVLLIDNGDGCHAVMGRAIAHAGPQMASKGDEWLVAVRALDGGWFYIHEPDSIEVLG